VADPIRFHFDFSSPYSYIASREIDALGAKHGREVVWRPMLLGAAFKAMGATPIAEVPLKGVYSIRDFARSARFHGAAYRHPTPFPVSTVSAARVFLWLDARDPAAAKGLAAALFEAYFVEGLNISIADVVVAVAARQGLDAASVTAAMSDPAIKEALKAEVDAALAAGVFGAPYFFVDGEPFWGADRLDQMDRWLAQGGF
jgi:2-hydroxychromene-2-carboxylate isomerase